MNESQKIVSFLDVEYLTPTRDCALSCLLARFTMRLPTGTRWRPLTRWQACP